MNELVHDLTSALEESELKIEVDEDFIDRCSSVSIHKKIKRLGFSDEDLSNGTGVNNNRKKIAKVTFHAFHKTKQSKVKNKISVVESCSGSDTESAFVLPKPTVRKHRRKKNHRMETEPEPSICRSEIKDTVRKKQCRQVVVKNMDLEISPDYLASLKELDTGSCKFEDESDISTSEDSNNDINGRVS